MDTKTKFKKWFMNRYLYWQEHVIHRLATITEFANYLEVNKMNASRWLSGNALPDEANAFKIGIKLGIEVFDALDMPRPDPTLFEIWQHWDEFSPAQQRAFRGQLDEFLGENESSATARSSY